MKMDIKPIEAYYFTAGGVLLPRLAHVTLDVLEKASGKRLAGKQRIAIYDLEKDVFVGRMGAGEYLEAVCRQGVWTGSSADLQAGILECITCDPGALAVAQDIRKGGRLYVYSDYPRPWLDEAARRFGLYDIFEPLNVIEAAQLHPADNMDDLFAALNQAGHTLAGKSMWIDGHPLRTSAAIRRGIDAIIYVDERRLRRELGLRGFPGGSAGYR